MSMLRNEKTGYIRFQVTSSETDFAFDTWVSGIIKLFAIQSLVIGSGGGFREVKTVFSMAWQVV